MLRRARATGTDASKCLPCTEYGADAFLFVYFNDYTAHLHKLDGLHKHRAVSAAGQDVIERPVTRLAAAAAGVTGKHTVQENPLHHQGKQKRKLVVLLSVLVSEWLAGNWLAQT